MTLTSTIKPATKEAIDEFVRIGRPPGNFLMAVLTNNLSEAFMRADLENQCILFEIVKYCYHELPAGCWGSMRKVSDWIDQGGAEGQNLPQPCQCPTCGEETQFGVEQ